MRKYLAPSLAAVALTFSAPVLAQSEDEDGDSVMTAPAEPMSDDASMEMVMGMLGGLFKVEPLTAEQEARLPQATSVIEKLMPEGTMVEMMGSMFDGMLKPLMELEEQFGEGASETVANGIGVSRYDLDLTDEQADELAKMFDPAWRERKAIERALAPEMMRSMMAAMEPSMRKAMAELYAVNFNETELAGIDAFFSTEIGASYARKSFTMASDPRIISVSMESFPAMMEAISAMEEKKQAAEANLPPARSFADLTAKERARIAALTGFSAEEIEELLSMRDATESGEWEEAEAEAEPVD